MTTAKQCILITAAMCALSVQSAVVSNLVQDSGFESLTGTEPDETSTPWFTIGEDGAGSVTIATNVYHSGSQSVSFNWHGDLATVGQSLGVTLDSSKNYEVSVWMYSYYENTGVVNDADLNITLVRSDDGGETWTWMANPLFKIKNSETNIWEQFTTVIDGSDYAAYDGQLLELRISKVSASTYRMAVDDVEFGEEDPVQLVSNLLQDPGFETFSGTEPDDTSTPWFTVGEDGPGSVSVSTDVFHGGLQSLSFNWHGDLANVRQDMAALDSNKTYAVSCWMYSYYENTGVDNDADLNVALFRSNDGGTTWSWLANPLFQIKNNQINKWEKFTAVVDGHDYAAYDGQLLQLRIAKVSASTYRMAVDDLEFGEIGSPVIDLISISNLGSGQIALSWEGSTSLSYGIKSCTDLSTGNWSNMVSGLVGISGSMVVTTTVTGAQAFYRLTGE